MVVGWGIRGMKKGFLLSQYYGEKLRGKWLFIPPAILHWFDGSHFLQEEWHFRFVVEDVM